MADCVLFHSAQPPVIGQINDKGGTTPNSTYAVTTERRRRDYPDGYVPLPLSWAACITCSEDVDFTSNLTAISAEWAHAHDPDSGVFAAEWAVGTDGEVDNIVAWRTAVDAGISSNDTSVWARPVPGMLTHNTTYHVTVRVRNGAGLVSTATSDGVTVDTTPPVVTSVWDRDPTQPRNVSVETNVSVATNLASATVHAHDPESGLLEWHYAVSTSPTTCTQVYAWVAVIIPSPFDEVLVHSAENLNLVPGATYYHCVRVVNQAGVASEVHFSDGWRVGLRADVLPSSMAALLFVDPDNVAQPARSVSMVVNVTEGAFSTPASRYTLEASLSDVSPPSQISLRDSGYATALLASGYVRQIDFPSGDMQLSPLRVQVRYLTNLTNANVTLPTDVDAWLMMQSVPGRRLNRRGAADAGRDERLERSLAPEGWELLSHTCNDRETYSRTIDVDKGVVSGWMCRPGVVAMFYQHRPTVTLSLAKSRSTVRLANESRFVTVHGVASDPDEARGGYIVSTRWSVSTPFSPQPALQLLSASTASIGPLLQGVTTISMTAVDDMNATTTTSIKVEVLPFSQHGNVSLCLESGVSFVGMSSLQFSVRGVGVAAGDQVFLVSTPTTNCSMVTISKAYAFGTLRKDHVVSINLPSGGHASPLTLCYQHGRNSPVLYSSTLVSKVCWHGGAQGKAGSSTRVMLVL